MKEMTIYVERSAGRWEARYWDRDENRYWTFTDYDQTAAVNRAKKSTGYQGRECKFRIVIC